MSNFDYQFFGEKERTRGAPACGRCQTGQFSSRPRSFPQDTPRYAILGCAIGSQSRSGEKGNAVRVCAPVGICRMCNVVLKSEGATLVAYPHAEIWHGAACGGFGVVCAYTCLSRRRSRVRLPSLPPNSRHSLETVERADSSKFRPSKRTFVTCNFHAGVASNPRANLYFIQANEAIWQRRRFVAVASSIGDADHGVSRTRGRHDCR
jgi:hypothetical protein